MVVFDRLSAAALLDMAPVGAERINVGKTPGAPATAQDEINALLVDRGRTGRRVVRLKGGDPFVFGRGGEECAALAAAGVAFEVVPGVTSAIAAPAYAGVPLTHRGISSSVTIVTGHDDETRPAMPTGTRWRAWATRGGTVVVLMGAAARAEIAVRLTDGGMDPDDRSNRGDVGHAARAGGRAHDPRGPRRCRRARAGHDRDRRCRRAGRRPGVVPGPAEPRSVVVAAPTGEGGGEPDYGERIAAAARAEDARLSLR